MTRLEGFDEPPDLPFVVSPTSLGGATLPLRPRRCRPLPVPTHPPDSVFSPSRSGDTNSKRRSLPVTVHLEAQMRIRSSSVATQTSAAAGPSRTRSSTTSSPRPLPMVPSDEPAPSAPASLTTKHAETRHISLPVTRSDFQYYVPLSSKAGDAEPDVDPNAAPARHSVFYFKDELSIFQVRPSRSHFFSISECLSPMYAYLGGKYSVQSASLLSTEGFPNVPNDVLILAQDG